MGEEDGEVGSGWEVGSGGGGERLDREVAVAARRWGEEGCDEGRGVM